MSTDLATRPNASMAHVPIGAKLTTLEEAMDMGRALAFTSLVPDTLRGKPNDVCLILLYGAELGLTPMQAIQGIYVVKGRPMLSAQTWITKINQHRHRLEFLETSRSLATVRITRGDNGTVHTLTFTIEEAAAAGLCKIIDGKVMCRDSKGGPLPWEAWTATMLRNRAVTHLARFACPEVAFGNAGVHGEELDDNQRDDPDLRPWAVEADVIDGEAVDPDDSARQLADLAAELGVTTTANRPRPGRELPDAIEDVEEVSFPEPQAGRVERTCEVCGIDAEPGTGSHPWRVREAGLDEHEPVWSAA